MKIDKLIRKLEYVNYEDLENSELVKLQTTCYRVYAKSLKERMSRKGFEYKSNTATWRIV